MKLFATILLVCILQGVLSTYKYRSYFSYLQQWRDLASNNSHLQQIDVNQDAYELPPADCIAKCQYPVFQYNNNQSEWSPTILFISGFHGNQPLGPHILLQYARRLNRGHIIFFPLANPSGYAHKLRQEQPSQIDPNRDFPYNNQQCMKTATTRIVDRIFRRWKIDLTLSVHQGGEQLGWNWGTKLHLNQETADQMIYKQIAHGVVRGLNSGFMGTSIYKLGQMNQIIYPAEGTFDDWAYAGSWDTVNTIKECTRFKFPEYPHDMHRGLVFILESAPHNALQHNLESEEEIKQKELASLQHKDYLSRSIRILEAFVDVANPRLQITSNKQQIKFEVMGCHTAKLFITIKDRIYKSLVFGSLNPEFASFVLRRDQIDQIQQTGLNLSYQISCDVGWRDVGKTSFSRGRDYSGLKQIQLSDKEVEKDNYLKDNVFMVAILLFCLVLLLASVWICKKKCQKNKKLAIKQSHESIKTQSSFRTSHHSVAQEHNDTIVQQ